MYLFSNVLGTPPPPTNLTHTDVTETRIDIEWDKPIGHELFAIHGYRVSHKKSSDAAFTIMNISSNGELNSVLNNLQKDTFYIITVRGYNNDGDGDEQKIEVTTKKSEDCKYFIAWQNFMVRHAISKQDYWFKSSDQLTNYVVTK